MLTVTSPANGAIMEAPVVISGSATDNAVVANVEIAVRDQASGQVVGDPRPARG